MLKSGWSWQFRLASYLAIARALFAFREERAIAQNQIVPHDTSGGERSSVTPDVIKGIESDFYFSFIQFVVSNN